MTNTRIGHMLATAREQTTSEQLRSLPDRLVGWGPLPPLLLLAALSTIFIFANDRGAFYRPGHHNNFSMLTLSLATNLSPEHNFLLTQYLTFDQSTGETGYWPYGRFPIGNYALLKIAGLPFESDLSKQIQSARVVMLLFFIGSGLLVYFALTKIFKSPWVALGSTALSFSSYYVLYYSDMVSAETMSNLFGVFLIFHGMTIFVQEGRFRQLLIKTFIALFFGWHSYAILLPFIIFGVIRDFRQRKSIDTKSNGTRWVYSLSRVVANRFLILAMIAFLWGAILLSFNLVNEYLALDGERAWRDLPTVQSLRLRTGFNAMLNEEHRDALNIRAFTFENMYRIGGNSIPFSLPGFSNNLGLSKDSALETHGVALGIAFLALATLIIFATRAKILIVPLVAMGFVWSFPFRHQSAFHDTESIFYIGIPLVTFSILIMYIQRVVNVKISALLSLLSLLILCFSIAQISRIGYDNNEKIQQKFLFDDIEKVRTYADEKVLFISIPLINERFSLGWPLGFYFPDSLISIDGDNRSADYVLSGESLAGTETLIPDTVSIFLYNVDEYNWGYDEVISRAASTASRLAMTGTDISPTESFYSAYHEQGAVWYIRDGPCDAGPAERDATFFLHVVPLNVEDLPASRREFGFDGLDFFPEEHWLDAGGYCIIRRDLPQYGITSIRTGQYDASGELWSGEIRIAEPE